MTEHSETTAKNDDDVRALASEAAVPPPHPSPMPMQVIEFWTPRLMFMGLLFWLGRALRRGSRGTALSAADSHEPR